MAAFFDHAPPAQNQDAVGPAHRGEPVRDHDARAPLQQPVEGPFDPGLGREIHRRRRLVQHQQRGLGQQRPGEGDELALPDAQATAALAGVRLVALGEPADKRVGPDYPCRPLDLLVRGLRAAVADVLPDRTGKQERVLQHHAHVPPQAGAAHAAQVLAVHADRAPVGS